MYKEKQKVEQAFKYKSCLNINQKNGQFYHRNIFNE